MPAKLRFTHDSEPGLSRRWRYERWHFFDPAGERVTEAETVKRLNGLAVPPAYERVWYCVYPNGHLQATGYDARGRKQYRYHPDFRARQEADKFGRTLAFGHLLPRLRAQVERDLGGRKLSKPRMLAATVRLLDVGRLRPGNTGYTAANGSYGATTLTKAHAEVHGGSVTLDYRAKGGKDRHVKIKDAALARLARRCQDLPGQHLFAYENEAGEGRAVTSDEVNDYIRDATGEDFTAKHFRTWHASVIAFGAIVNADGALSLKEMLAPVADELGNTMAVSRKSYVHPTLVECVKENGCTAYAGLKLPRPTKYLTRLERGLIAFLEADAAPIAKAA